MHVRQDALLDDWLLLGQPFIVTAAPWAWDLEAETWKKLRFSHCLCLAWPTIHRLHHRAPSPRRIGFLLRTALAEVIVDDPTTVTKPSARYVSLSGLSVGPARTAYVPVRVGADGAVNVVGADAGRRCPWVHPVVMAHNYLHVLEPPHGMTLGHSAGENGLSYAQPVGSTTEHHYVKKSGTETVVRYSVAVRPSVGPWLSSSSATLLLCGRTG